MLTQNKGQWKSSVALSTCQRYSLLKVARGATICRLAVLTEAALAHFRGDGVSGVGPSSPIVCWCTERSTLTRVPQADSLSERSSGEGPHERSSARVRDGPSPLSFKQVAD